MNTTVSQIGLHRVGFVFYIYINGMEQYRVFCPVEGLWIKLCNVARRVTASVVGNDTFTVVLFCYTPLSSMNVCHILEVTICVLPIKLYMLGSVLVDSNCSGLLPLTNCITVLLTVF